MEIKPTEQAQLLQNARAVTHPLPQEFNPVAKTSRKLQVANRKYERSQFSQTKLEPTPVRSQDKLSQNQLATCHLRLGKSGNLNLTQTNPL